jgi:hypothetical protein
MTDDLETRRMASIGGVGSLTLSLVLYLILLAAVTGCQERPTATKEPVAQKTPPKPVVIATLPVEKRVDVNEKSVGAAPKMTFEEMVHDFGEVDPGSRNTAQFKFTNTGTAPLEIYNVQPCCGVTTRGLSAGQVYEPGQSGALELTFPASSQPGSVLRYIHIQTNDPTQQTVTLTFKAEVVRRVAYEPTVLRLFLKRENGGADDITLTSLNGQPFSVVSFRSTADAITAEFDPAVKDTRFVLKLKVDMDKLQRHLRGRIAIELTHPGCKYIDINYDVLPEFTIRPPQILAFNLKAGQPIQKEIWILDNYGEDFDIDTISSKNGIIKVIESEKVKQPAGPVVGSAVVPNESERGKDQYQYRLKLEITPPEQTTPLSDVLTVAIRNGDTLSIDFRGFYGGT